ncbi:MAG TPA: pyridoxamine 5'-phosphate oxidase family protein [Longimicrobiaceae bacterium]|jgi:nitroimidazol reductase NimA-like FMN-containing flavoprotein (pyridoxamine 5'-phosphate oxidase superfamily)|nr:pyridoxamine 5'-phosphate oxidase family protein [Longimicrobiaceae bacterium]
MTMQQPHFRDLDREEIDALLARHHIGRLAYRDGEHVDIEPIHYVYADGWIYGRTAPGTKVEAVQRQWWVAFEIDEVEGLFDWRSVVVHGGFYILQEDAPEAEREVREHAVTLLRRLVPSTFAAGDPAPFRTIVFRIAVQEVRGIAASTRRKLAER